MNYAVGYGLNLKDIFFNFRIKRLKLSALKCMELLGNRHKEVLMYKIMKYCIKLVLDDIIDNNATFKFPTGKKKVTLLVRRTEGDDFIRARLNGKWLDVDFLASNFSGYLLTLKFMYGEVFKTKTVYLDSTNKDKLTQHTNNGKLYF